VQQPFVTGRHLIPILRMRDDVGLVVDQAAGQGTCFVRGYVAEVEEVTHGAGAAPEPGTHAAWAQHAEADAPLRDLATERFREPDEEVERMFDSAVSINMELPVASS
jgi:hypothetical protein